MLVIAALVVSLMEPGNLGWIVAALIASGVVQALIGIYEFRGGSGAPSLWILDFHYFRAFGTFGQPNPFGAFMGLTLALALGATYGCLSELWTQFRAAHQIPRDVLMWAALYGAGAALLAVGLVVSWSRGAWMGVESAAM